MSEPDWYMATDWIKLPAGGNSLRQKFVRLEDYHALAAHLDNPPLVAENNALAARVAQLEAEVALWKSNHRGASALADDLTQDGIKERARIRSLEAALREIAKDTTPDPWGLARHALMAPLGKEVAP